MNIYDLAMLVKEIFDKDSNIGILNDALQDLKIEPIQKVTLYYIWADDDFIYEYVTFDKKDLKYELVDLTFIGKKIFNSYYESRIFVNYSSSYVYDEMFFYGYTLEESNTNFNSYLLMTYDKEDFMNDQDDED